MIEQMVAKTTARASLSVSVRGKVGDSLNLAPIDTITLEPEDAPLFQGVPRKPKFWVRPSALLSANGERINIDTPQPDEITPTSHTRFVALPEYWDPDSMVWLPFFSSTTSWAIQATTLPSRPSLEQYDIVTREGVLRRWAFDLANGAYLVTNFASNQVLSQTISLVMQPMEDDTPIFDWTNINDLNHQPPPLARTAIWKTDKYDFHWSGTGASVDPVVPTSKHNPVYITMVIDPPEVRLFVSLSPKHNFQRAKAAVSTLNTTPLQLGIGRSALSTTPGNMRLFEINFWDEALEDSAVMAHHATMMSSYGVHYEWG